MSDLVAADGTAYGRGLGTSDLVAAAHGTADRRGIRAVHDLVREIAGQRTEVPVSLGFVDVDHPALSGVVDRVVGDGARAVVVPLLLSSGYHVCRDVAGEVTRYPGVVAAAGALGPDAAVAEILADRVRELPVADRVVLAAAGSSDPRALRDCSVVAAELSLVLGVPVEVGYVSGAGERLSSVLARVSGRVAVATYLLAPGFFADRVAAIAGRASRPLGADPRLAALALRRYDEVEGLRFGRGDLRQVQATAG
ncbi:sirohydrochlorin chelatase [Kribbella sp. NPDC051770]|uniref:sirohydrochlorin chelatase n=1 Tax=Kribbella sp. NPDC051770 TaxID=3155413 RepID=UPI003412C0CE